MKSKRKAIKDLAQSKIVNISDYRELQTGQEAQRIAIVTPNQEYFEKLRQEFPEALHIERFEGRFAFEQSLKSQQEWDAVLLDERDLKDEALQICEKMKRQNRQEELVLFILSEDASKDRVRTGLEKGCDEWVTRVEDTSGIVRLLDHHINFSH